MDAYPRAVSRFGLAAMERRAGRTRRTMAGAAPPRRRTVVRLWLPMTLLFLLLSPFALLLAVMAWPFLGFAPPAYRVNPFAAVFGLGRLLLALGGTVVDVDTPDALVRLRIL